MFNMFKKNRAKVSEEEQQIKIDKILFEKLGWVGSTKEITKEIERNSIYFQDTKSGKIPVYKLRSK